MRTPWATSIVLLAVAFACSVGDQVAAAPVPATIVVMEGDGVGPSTVSAVNAPFTDGNGHVGFVGSLADAQRFIWWDSGPVFFSNDALPEVLTGAESTMGVSDNGGFIYSPSVDGQDAVYTHGGELLKSREPMPNMPGLYSTFNSRPTMLPDGTVHWIGGTAPTPTTASTNRHLLRATDPTDSTTIQALLSGGDVIDGKAIKTTASNFDYWISDNMLHHIHVLDMDVASTENEHVYVDGGFVAQESRPTGQGDNWQSFDIVSINNDGEYIFTGDTSGDAASDEFVACNGQIAVREGDTLHGMTIPSGSSLRAASINNEGRVAHMWGILQEEQLFFGEVGDLGNSVHLLSTGDSLDVNDDAVADFVVGDFGASAAIGPGLDLAGGAVVYLHVEMTPLGMTTPVKAVIAVSTSPSAEVAEATADARLRLCAASPQPFRRGGEIEFYMAQPGEVRLAIHDIMGRALRLLFTGPATAGTHTLSWDGRGANGRRLPCGTYFFRLESGGAAATDKVVLID